MNFVWTSVTLVLPLALLIILSNVVNNRRRRLPPGPAAVPLLGNLAWLTITDGQQFMATLRSFHARYGPVIALRFGSTLEVSVADRRLAHTALVQLGAAVADRPLLASHDLLGHNSAFTITSSNYGALWRLLRRNLVAEMARLRLFAAERERALADLTHRLGCRKQGDEAIMDMFQHAMFCIFVSMCFGQSVDEHAVRDITAALRQLMLYSTTELNVFVFVPAITTRVFGGRRRAMDAMRSRLKDLYLPLIDARRRRRLLQEAGAGNDDDTMFPHSYVDALLDIRLNHDGGRGLTDDEISALCSEFLSGGTDLPSSALQWTMAELVKNPAIQDKLYREIRAVTGGDKVSEEDLQRMPYLKAVVLESLRRHPPGHQLVPHAAAADVELGGYVIPKGATVNFLAVDFGLDEVVWERPMDFVPERFMPGGHGEAVDVTGTREIKMMPFGAGRRICPGLAVATLHLEYFVANLVNTFEWQEVEGMEVDVIAERFDFSAVMKKPFEVNLVARAEKC